MRRALLFTLTAAIAVFLFGFVMFAENVTRLRPPDGNLQADGVVALTGGGGARITTAMQLLQQGNAQRMLVTGVNPAVSETQLRRLTGGPDELFACCVDIGRAAKSTDGNGAETAAWAQSHAMTSLIIVTSDFHMPRTLIVLRASLGDVELTAWPVRSPGSEMRPWWRHASTTRYLALEYVKFVVFAARAALFNDPDPEP